MKKKLLIKAKKAKRKMERAIFEGMFRGVLILILFTGKAEAQTANAGADQTIYLTEGNTATLDGSGSSGNSYKWTEVSTDYSSGSTISNSTSKVASVSGLPQGVFYFQIAVTSGANVATAKMKVIVDYSPPPTLSSLVKYLDIQALAPKANDRSDTTNYLGYTTPNHYTGTPDTWMERARSNGMYVDNQYGKFYSIVEDGYQWNYSGYNRTELYFGDYTINTGTTYVLEWKGYFPQTDAIATGDFTTLTQLHGSDGYSPVFQIYYSFATRTLKMVETDANNNQTASVSISNYSSFVDQCHTIRIVFKEGYAGSGAFVEVFLDGVRKYYRATGQVGRFSDYPKFATVYDWNRSLVDPNNHTRNWSFSLVTEAYRIYVVSDTSGVGGGTPSAPAPIPVPITWATPSAITYGTPISSTQLNASAGTVSGTMTYDYSIGDVLNAGSYTLTATFTPTDQTTYQITQKSVTLTVNKALAIMSYSDTVKTYNGNLQYPTITTFPAGLTGVSTTYNNHGPVSDAGTYALKSGINNANYYANNIIGTFIINKASATISVSNLTQTYTGSQLPITASVSPSVSGLSITYNGSSTVPTNAGTYQVIIKITNTNYQATPDTVTYVIAKKTPTVSWSNPSAITYGTALSGTQLNATASVSGTFTYTPASGTILNAGNQILSVNFTPTDTTDYNSVNNTTVSLIVNKAAATITLSNLNQTYDGTPKPVTVTTSPVGLGVITTTYNGSTTVPYAVGSYTVSSSLNNSNYTATPATGTLVISTSAASIYITDYSNLVYNGNPQTPTVTCAYSYDITYDGSATAPTNVGSYQAIATINDGIHTGADTVTMTIIKATPTITWSNPSTITYGTALSGTQLNASSTVSGTFVYSPASGTVLNAGTYTLSTTFTPTDESNYNTATKTVNITVNKATAVITLSGLSQTYDGTSKPVTVTISPLVSGLTVTYNGSTTPATNAGSYPIVASLSNTNYSATPQTGTLVIAKVSPVLSWATPAQITESTPLSSTQLNATSNIAGTFSYNYPTGTKFPAGTYSLVATFTPTDTTNYNGGTITTVLIVAGNPYSDYFITNGQIFWYPLQ